MSSSFSYSGLGENLLTWFLMTPWLRPLGASDEVIYPFVTTWPHHFYPAVTHSSSPFATWERLCTVRLCHQRLWHLTQSSPSSTPASITGDRNKQETSSPITASVTSDLSGFSGSHLSPQPHAGSSKMHHLLAFSPSMLRSPYVSSRDFYLETLTTVKIHNAQVSLKMV